MHQLVIINYYLDQKTLPDIIIKNNSKKLH